LGVIKTSTVGKQLMFIARYLQDSK
jgi:hypothetical protein